MPIYKPGSRVSHCTLKGSLFRVVLLLIIFSLLYASVLLGKGTVRHTADYGIKEACIKLYEAMKGLGTNESVIINVLSSHTMEQRQQIKKQYTTLYNKDLVKELNSELSFSFSKLVQAMMVDSETYVLDCINKCVCSISDKQNRRLFKRLSSIFREGLGGKEYICMGLLCPRSNEELAEIKKIYKKTFGDKLETKITEDGNNMSNDFCSFVIDIIGGDREETDELDMELVAEDAETLAGSSNEDVLHQLLQERGFPHLRKVFEDMMDYGKTINDLVDELQGQIPVEMVDAYRGMVTLIVDGEPTYWADTIKRAIDGAGTDDDTLIKAIVMRAEVDLVDVMDAYQKKYKVDMAEEVADDTSGDYKILISKLLVRPPPGHEAPQVDKEQEQLEVVPEPASTETSEPEVTKAESKVTKASKEVVPTEEEVTQEQVMTVSSPPVDSKKVETPVEEEIIPVEEPDPPEEEEVVEPTVTIVNQTEPAPDAEQETVGEESTEPDAANLVQDEAEAQAVEDAKEEKNVEPVSEEPATELEEAEPQTETADTDKVTETPEPDPLPRGNSLDDEEVDEKPKEDDED